MKKSILLFFHLLLTIFVNGQNKEIVFPIKHTSGLISLIYSEDKKYIATASNDKTIKLWYASDGNLMRNFIGHKEPVTCIDFSSNIKNIISGSLDSNIIVWNLNNGSQKFKPIHLSGKILTLCYSPDNYKIITGTDNGHLNIINTTTGNIENDIIIPDKKITCIKFVDKKSRFVVSLAKNSELNNTSEGSLFLYDLMFLEKPFAISNYKEDINYFTLNPDSSKIITAASNGMVRVWNSKSYVEEISFKNNNTVPGKVFMSGNGKMVGVTGLKDNIINIWRISGEKLFDFTLSMGKTIYGEFNDDNTRIHVCNDYGRFIIYDLNAREREKIGEYANSGSPVTAFSFADKGQRIAIGHKNGLIKSFDLKNSRPVRETISNNTAILDMDFSTDEKKIFVSIDQTVSYNESLNETTLGNAYLQFIDTSKTLKNKIVSLINEYSTSLTNYSNYCIAGFNNGVIKFYDINTGKVLNAIQGHDYDILNITVSDDKKWLFTSSMDASLKVWSINDFKITETNTFYFNSDVTNARYSPLFNNIILSVKNEGIKFIKNLNKEEIKSISSNAEISGIDNSDSLFFVSTKSDMTECSAYSAFNGEKIWSYNEPGSNIIDIAYSRLHQVLFCCKEDGNIMILNAKTGKELLNLIFISYYEWLVYSPEGKFDGSEKMISKVNIIDDLLFLDKSEVSKYHTDKLLNQVIKNK